MRLFLVIWHFISGRLLFSRVSSSYISPLLFQVESLLSCTSSSIVTNLLMSGNSFYGYISSLLQSLLFLSQILSLMYLLIILLEQFTGHSTILFLWHYFTIFFSHRQRPSLHKVSHFTYNARLLCAFFYSFYSSSSIGTTHDVQSTSSTCPICWIGIRSYEGCE